MPQKQAPAPTPPPPPGFDDVVYSDQTAAKQQGSYSFPTGSSAVPQFGVGLAKGAASTAKAVQEKLRGMNRPRYRADLTPEQRAKLESEAKPGGITIPQSWTEPTNWAQGFGKNIEQSGEYMVGASKVPFKVIPQALMSAGLAGLHSNEDPETMLGMGVVGGLTPAVLGALSRTMPARAFQAVLQWLSNKLPAAPTPPPGAGPGWFANLGRGLPPAAAQYQWGFDPQYSWSGGEPGQIAPPAPPEVSGLTVNTPALPPAPPPTQGQVGGRGGQPALPSGPQPKALPPAPGVALPPGTDVINRSEPALPARYAKTPVEGETPSPGGTMGAVNQGTPGPLPPPKTQDITAMPSRMRPVRLPNGQMHRLSSTEEHLGYILYRAKDGTMRRFNVPGGKTVAKAAGTPQPEPPTTKK